MMTTEKRPADATNDAAPKPKTEDKGQAIAADAGPVPASEGDAGAVPDPTL